MPTVEDDIQEQTESFTVNLSNPSGATIQDGTATGTINDDDDDDGGGNTPTLSIADAAASEGDPVVFTVTLTGARTGSVTVDYATTAGTASQGSDYTHTSRSLTFATNESSKTISVPTVEDTTGGTDRDLHRHPQQPRRRHHPGRSRHRHRHHHRRRRRRRARGRHAQPVHRGRDGERG